jgi:exonuclease VII large subunit
MGWEDDHAVEARDEEAVGQRSKSALRNERQRSLQIQREVARKRQELVRENNRRLQQMKRDLERRVQQDLRVYERPEPSLGACVEELRGCPEARDFSLAQPHDGEHLHAHARRNPRLTNAARTQRGPEAPTRHVLR